MVDAPLALAYMSIYMSIISARNGITAGHGRLETAIVFYSDTNVAVQVLSISSTYTAVKRTNFIL
jgi:hypothetical protein